MTLPLSPPNVEFSAANKGGDYLAKLQLLSQAIDTTCLAFNAQIAAAQTAEQISEAVSQMLEATNALVIEAQGYVTQVYNAIGTAGNTAQFATQLLTSRTIAGKPFNGTQNVVLAATDVGARPASWVPQISDVPGLSAELRKIKLYALSGI